MLKGSTVTGTEPPMPTVAELDRERPAYVMTGPTELTAYRIGTWIAERAIDQGLVITVEVILAGRLVFRAALPGTSDRNDMYLRGKRKVVELHGRPSLYERMRYAEQGTTFVDATGLAFPEYAAHGGGVPMLSADGELLGMVIVSGLPMVQDHELAVAAIRAVARGS